MARKIVFMVKIVALLGWLARSLGITHAQDDTTWLLEQINGLRASLGLSPYVLNAQLSAAAYQHSEYMAATCDVSHTESNGSTPADRARANGYTGDMVSENIYGGGRAQASNAWNFWINSPVHYAGLTHGTMNEIGIGIARGNCGQYFTLVFGHGSSVAAPPPPANPSGENAPPAAAPPAPKPYVPPPPTSTPTATIPTLTPSPTWTLTPTYTPSLTPLPETPSATPLALPTVAVEEVAQIPTSTFTPFPAPSDTLLPAVEPSSTPAPSPTPIPQPAAVGDVSQGGFSVRDLIPFALIGQIVLIGVAGFVYFRRSQ